MERVLSKLLMAQYMRGVGRINCITVLENKSFKTVLYMRVNLSMVRNLVLAYIHGLKAPNIKGSLQTVNLIRKVNIHGLMEEGTMVNGKWVKCMVMENYTTNRVGKFTKGNLSMIRSQDMVPKLNLTAKKVYMKVGGSMTKNMAKGSTLPSMEKL